MNQVFLDVYIYSNDSTKCTSQLHTDHGCASLAPVTGSSVESAPELSLWSPQCLRSSKGEVPAKGRVQHKSCSHLTCQAAASTCRLPLLATAATCPELLGFEGSTKGCQSSKVR